MPISDELHRAFAFHMRNERPAFYYTEGYRGRNAWPEKAHGIAREALRRAREDVTAGKRRYPAPIRAKYRASDADGLRYIGRVSPEFRRGPFGGRDSEGWITDPYGHVSRDGSGLCYGVVYQLAGRKGESRYVAGYQMGDCDGGATLDLATIYTAPRGTSYWDGSAQDNPGSRDAARAADEMARIAAEHEREYQTAWAAGSSFAALGEEVQQARAEALAILKARRLAIANAALSDPAYFALCDAIRAQVKGLLRTIGKARAKREELASGDAEDLYFYPDARLKEAFCSGADIAAFPG